MARIVSGSIVVLDGNRDRPFIVRHVDGAAVRIVHEGDRVGVVVDVGRLERVEIRGSVSCSACGRFWVQHGNRTGHCAACHQTFEGLTLWDAHQRVSADGSVVCLDPARMRWRGSRLRLVEGSWRGPRMGAGVFENEEEQSND